MDSHFSADYPEWGSAPRGPLVRLDRAHQGEWMGSVIGKDPVTGEPMVYQLLRCELCILLHLWPLPSEEALRTFYAREFYQTAHPDYLARYEADRAWWALCMHGPLLNSLRDASQDLSGSPRILDVGAGPGLLLDEARRRGWTTEALEPSLPCATRLRARGHRVLDGSLLDIPKETYDCLTMWEVLEHVPNPEETLLDVWNVLQPGGVLGLVVPNEWTPGQLEACRRFGVSRWWIAAPEHLNYFTPKTLQLVARRAGFQQVTMRSTYPMVEQFLLTEGRCYVGNDSLGRACHQERMAREMAQMRAGQWATMETEYIANVAMRRGRELVYVGRKPLA